MMLNSSAHLRRYAIVALVCLLAVIPLITTSNYYLGTMIVIGIYTLVTVGLCLLMGYAGQISLGHAAFYGLGAYGSGILTATYNVNPWLAMVLAAAITAVIALAIGAPILRLKGHYLALASLGFGVIIYFIFVQGGTVTGGPSGLTGIPGLKIGSFKFNSDTRYYYLVWIIALAGIVAAHNLVKSRIGRALRAINGSEVAAESMGINTARMKVQIFVISAIYGSIAGSLYVHYVNFVNPPPFGVFQSAHFVLMAVVGGIANVWGPLFGVTLVIILSAVLREFVSLIITSASGEFEIIFFGFILIVVMIFMPEGLVAGIVNLVERVWQRRSGKARKAKIIPRVVENNSLNSEN